MKFKNFVLDQINLGLFYYDKSSVTAEPEQSFFMFNYLNNECDLTFKQNPNALWFLSESDRSIQGFMPLSKHEYFCYLLCASNLIFKKEVDENEILVVLDNYLKLHPVYSWYNDFVEFTAPLRHAIKR